MKAKEFAIVEAKTSRKNESVAVSPPKFPDDMPEDEKRAAWNKWLRDQTKKSVDAQRDIQDLANQLRKRKEEKENSGSAADSDEFAKQQDQHDARKQRAKSLGAKFDEGNMSPQQQHDFDRMRYGAMSRKEYHAKYKQPRKSDAEVMHRKRKNTEEAYDGDPDEYHVLRHRSKRNIEREITVTRLWDKIKQFDSYQQAIRARDEMTAKHPGERFTVTTHKKPSATEGYAGVDDTDTVGFSVNTEAAYTAVMKRFGDVIDHDETTGIMYAPAGVWPRIEMVAFDADGEGAVRDDGVAENDRSEMDTPEFQRALSSVKKKAAQGPKKTVYDPRTGKYKVVPINNKGSKND